MRVRFSVMAMVALLILGFSVPSLPLRAAAPKSVAVEHQRRIALVLGNSRYANSPLTNPARDADLIARTLKSLGFEVRLAQDANQTEMKRAIQAFGADLEKAGADAVGLFYYAGHGLQINGRNYLIPVGAKIDRDADVEIEAVSADWVLEEMRYARNRLNFVILDACRNNPFVRSFRGAGGGLARMDAPAGVLIAYSTAPGEVAEDGAGVNSPYSEALAQAMLQRHEPAELMFKHARDGVRQATAQRQTPWESSSLTGQDFYFAGSAPARPSGTDAVPNRPPATLPVVPVARSPESGSPDFMSDALCARAVGSWKIESDAMNGSIQLNADASAQIRMRLKTELMPASWDCDAANRRIVVSLGGHDQHEVVMDGEEKLLFGYNKAGVPITYSR